MVNHKSAHAGLKLLLLVIWTISVMGVRPETLYRLPILLLFPIKDIIDHRKNIFKTLITAEPILFFVGLTNAFMQHAPVRLYGLEMSYGIWLFVVLLLKGGLAVVGVTSVIDKMTISGLSKGMRWLKVPNAFILIFMQTYRYVGLLKKTVFQMQTAYLLRNKGKLSVHKGAWGSFPGQLFVKSLKQAEATHQAMTLRGYREDAHIVQNEAIRRNDWVYFLIWASLFTVVNLML